MVTGEDVPMPHSEETLAIAEAEALLQRQAALQAEATAVLTELNLVDRPKSSRPRSPAGISDLLVARILAWRDHW
jgi:hypothetical protein